ncbi:MAG TPA: hypothetical protein VGK58_23535 [Lacipirellulaceae bacterium]
MCAPWSTKVDKFLALALTSRIVGLNTLTAACADFSTNRLNAGALDELCSHLIAKQVLTEWQCEKLRLGRWKGYLIDDYCLLNELDGTNTAKRYLAKELSTGRQVAFVFTPRAFRPDGQVDYRIEELP